MPKMGYDMTEGKLLRWIKHEGDTVAKGEAVAEIETDKVNIEVEAFDSGVLQRIMVQEGQTVPVGERIGILAAPGESVAEAEQPATAAASTPAPAATPAQASAAPASAATGTGQQTPAISGGNGHAPASAGAGAGERIKASPLARRLAQEHDLNLAAIAGTGPGGRVTRDDVLNAAASAGAAPQAAPQPAVAATPATPAQPAAPEPALAASAGEKPLTRLQQTMARRMVE